MAAQTARFYLEQSLVELEDLESQGLFDKHELNIIMRRRTDFEHRIASRATKPKDFLRYAEYEVAVEKLRLKRVERLGKEGNSESDEEYENGDGEDGEGSGSASKRDHSKGRGISSYAGPRRIFFIFERGTKKYPNEISLLWLPYIRFASSQGSVYVLAKIYTRLLQLHPTMPSVWIMAAKYELDTHGAIKAARAIMQRGLKVNGQKMEMWVEYMKLELIYVAQLLARRRVLGLITEAQQRAENGSGSDNNGDDLKKNKDLIELPTLDPELESKASALLKSLPDIDIDMLGNPSTNPALRGDIALLVFDSALPELVKYTANKVQEKQKVLQKFGEQVLDMLVPFCKDYDNEEGNGNKRGRKFSTETAQLDGIYLGTKIIESLERSMGSVSFSSSSNDEEDSTNTTSGVVPPFIAYCHTILPIMYTSASSPLFPDGLKQVLDKFTKKYSPKGVNSEYNGSKKVPQRVRIEYAELVAKYLCDRFALNEYEEGGNEDNQGGEKKEKLEPNLLLLVKSLVAKCDSMQ